MSIGGFKIKINQMEEKFDAAGVTPAKAEEKKERKNPLIIDQETGMQITEREYEEKRKKRIEGMEDWREQR